MTEKIRVLILEDHQVTLDGLRFGLAQEQGIEVVGAAAGSQDGLELAAKLKPDVILLDLHLPGDLGPKTMVKQFCDTGSSVLIFSGESRMAFIQAVLAVGVCGYLLKSETVARVAQAIRDIHAGKKPIISSELAGGDDTRLTRSEQEVLRLLAKGMKYQDMADERLTSPATVRKQCEMLLLKLGLKTREELISWAVQNGYANLDAGP